MKSAVDRNGCEKSVDEEPFQLEVRPECQNKNDVSYIGFLVFFVSSVLFAPTASILFAGHAELTSLFYILLLAMIAGAIMVAVGVCLYKDQHSNPIT